jgi:hypothetical protein
MFQLWKLFKLMNRRIQCVLLGESLYMDSNQLPIGGHESFWIFIIIEEIYRQFKSDCCGRSPILLLNGEWDIFGCFSIFCPSLKMLWLSARLYTYIQTQAAQSYPVLLITLYLYINSILKIIRKSCVINLLRYIFI